MVDYRKDNLFGGRNQYTRIYYEGGYTDKYYYGYELSKNQNYKLKDNYKWIKNNIFYKIKNAIC